jgi:hypothetical protein
MRRVIAPQPQPFWAPPGFVTQCPDGLGFLLPVTPWITALWVIVYALCAETALLGLGMLVLWLRRTVSRSALVSLLLVTGCAGGALAVAIWMTNRDIQSCFDIPFSPHFTPALHVQAERLYAELLTQAHIALGVLVAVFVLATALTVVTLIRGWRANRRRNGTAPA